MYNIIHIILSLYMYIAVISYTIILLQDMMNRRISMKLMLEHAQDNANRQFIFFTPQDMRLVIYLCKIHQL